MKTLTLLATTLALLLLPTRLPRWLDSVPPLAREPLRRLSGTVVRGTVVRNDTIAALLSGTVQPSLVAQMVSASRPVYDLARIAAGRPFEVSLGPDGLFRAFSYGIDELRTLRVARTEGRLVAEVLAREYETRTRVVSGTVESSLFGAVEDAGEGDQLALDIADIFAWDVDFHTELQRGDGFRVVVEKQYLDGTMARYGHVLAAEFVRGERVLRAVRFASGGAAGYYDPSGRPLRKAFLRSPLRFTRISSRFSHARLHPILGVYRPHLGVDYAAPAGTPVQAAGDGVVVAAGWLGGYGRTVRLRHPNGYETLYGHLSQISVRAGQRVAQGQRIGAVGATGLATGPHLDYRMALNGRFVDPLRLKSPQAEPIAQSQRKAFAAECTGLLAKLAGDAPASAAAAGARASTRRP
ncbi:MAG TPA: peptidoglycan DD-metalloendopeptidase family protein [Vicinamibacteria bacterium]|nr:peptidoglycan DD-metalloendopeptidase family protein [Vicinamibacteria bacterium]